MRFVMDRDALWITGGVFMTLSALMNLATAVGNYVWTCAGMSMFGWEMDAVYGTLFFTYPHIPFSKVEGTCALCLAIGGFMSWVEDPTIQCVALLLQVFGCGYWIICAFYFVMVGQAVWAMIPFILLAISLGSAFTRGPGYVFEEDDSLETPFWVVTGIILGLSLIIGVAGVLTMNDEKRQLVERMKAIKKYVADNKDYKWPVENAHKTDDAPDNFEDAGNATTEDPKKADEEAETAEEAGKTENV